VKFYWICTALCVLLGVLTGDWLGVAAVVTIFGPLGLALHLTL
jgi:hypothetical protein